FHVPSANYFGLMNPTPTYVGVMGELLVAALNPQLATMARSQLAARIEQETLRWIGERIWAGGEQFAGTFTSGGNEANFSALAAALAWKFPKSVEEGIAGVGAQPVAYCSAEAHHSLDKSCGLLGIGRRALRRIPVTDRVQLDLQRLESAITEDRKAGRKAFCVVATAGTTNSGAIDDLAGAAELCRRHELWLHVDGAYGASAVFSERHRQLVRGIELADSVTVDPHKWLAMPFSAGVVLTPRPEALRAAFEVTTPYMPRVTVAGDAMQQQPAPAIDNFKISTQWSRRMNSLKLWLTLRIHGRQAYEQHINRQMELAAGFAKWIRESGKFEMASPMYVPILNLRARMPGAAEDDVRRAHERIVARVTADGQQWISTTEVAAPGELNKTGSVIRVMIISYLTDEQNLGQLQQRLLEAR
ncbi:MAG TPA: pyridoxal-dependent decarboxylase, partial [Terriglobales bacterium]|nr:pyridoxal-dependent decarboxylase [Terriglobales bacterium]